MLALSIRQPWAWLIIRPDLTGDERAAWLTSRARKDIENRTWPTRQRGRVLVHAGKGCSQLEWEDCNHFSKMVGGPEVPHLRTLDRGGVIGSVQIVDCVSTSKSFWFVGDFGFVLKDPQVLPFTSMRGALGFFEVASNLGSARGVGSDPQGQLL